MTYRIEQLQISLREDNIQAAVVRLPENVVMFSGHWPQNGICFLFIPSRGEPCLIAPIGEIIEPCGVEVKYFGWTRLIDKNPFESIFEILSSLRSLYHIKANSYIAAEMNYDAIAPPLCSAEILLPGASSISILAKVFDTNNLVPVQKYAYSMRAIKTESELRQIQKCNIAARKGIEYFKELIAKAAHGEKIREIDIAVEVEAYIAKNAMDMPGVTFCRSWAQVSSGQKTADAWFPGMISSSRQIGEGDFVMLELATVLNGFWCDLTETAVCGEPDNIQEKMLHAVKEAQKAALGEIRAGTMAKDIDFASKNYLDSEGFGEYVCHITGHGTGFGYHEASPIIGPHSEEIIQSGMVFSVEPGIYIPGVGGVRFECNASATDSGSIILGL